MAICHLTIRSISRGRGCSATAAAAYRSAEVVQDHTTGEVFNYTRKRGVEHAEIVLPADAARRDVHWARDRQQLWNAAERAEKRIDARVAREYEVALPHELSTAQRLELAREFSATIADRYGCAVDFAIHAPPPGGDERNYHAHILTTTRKVEAWGLGAKTEIELSNEGRLKRGLLSTRRELVAVRALWARMANEHLQAQGLDARIDHRPLEAQGIERQPTVHLGAAVSSMQRRGLKTEVGQRLELEATEGLERVAEIGRLQREGQELERSILALSAEIAALKDRDRLLMLGHDRVGEARRGKAMAAATPTVDMDAARQHAALRWKSYRGPGAVDHDAQERPSPLLQERDHAQEAWMEDAISARKTPPAPTPELEPKSAEERRQLAAERWLTYREGIAEGKSPAQATLAAGLEIENERPQSKHLDPGLDATDDD